MAIFSIVGSVTVDVVVAATLLKRRVFQADTGNTVIAVTPAATLLKRRRFVADSGNTTITVTPAAALLKRRSFTANTGNTLIKTVISALSKVIIPLPSGVVASRVFSCVITGAADSLPDLVIPISSLNISHNAGTSVSNMFIVCPDGPVFANGIIARSNGGIIITATDIYLDGTSDSTDLAEYAISGLQDNRGSKRHSISIQGAVTISRSFVNAIEVLNTTFTSLDKSGAMRVRMDMHKDMLPGDIITLPDLSTFAAGNISMVYNTSFMFMEVTKDA